MDDNLYQAIRERLAQVPAPGLTMTALRANLDADMPGMWEAVLKLECAGEVARSRGQDSKWRFTLTRRGRSHMISAQRHPSRQPRE